MFKILNYAIDRLKFFVACCVHNFGFEILDIILIAILISVPRIFYISRIVYNYVTSMRRVIFRAVRRH